MAYKVSFGNYQHSGSLQATVDITGSTTVSGAVGNFGTLTVGTFSPANISSTNITASSNMSASTANFGTLTVGTFSPANISTTNLTVTGVTTLSGNVFLGDAAADVITVNGQITGSLFAITGGTIDNTAIGVTTQRGGKFTALSASSTLDVVGTSTLQGLNAQATTATTLSASSTLQVGGTSTLQALNAQATTATTLSASSTLQVGSSATIANGLTVTAGTSALQAVTATTLSASSTLQVGGGISAAGNVSIGGNLTVQGTTTTVNSNILVIADKNIVIASGSANSSDANGSGLTLGNTGYQFNFQSSSAGTSSDFWQVSGTAGLTDFKAKTVFATVNGNVTQQVTNLGDADGTISLGINYSQADFTGPHTWTLPASPSVGHSVKIKAPHNCNGTNTLTVSASAGAIDFTGNTSVVLASPDAAMELVYVDSANTLWKIF